MSLPRLNTVYKLVISDAQVPKGVSALHPQVCLNMITFLVTPFNYELLPPSQSWNLRQ